MNARNALAAWCVALLNAGCAVMPRPGEAELAAGLRVYERGRFDDSAQFLQRSIDLGLSERDQVVAHKYLAFIHCAAGREVQCRDEFRLAIALDPAFGLGPAEVGHPSWGPAFRAVKGVR